MRGVCKKFEERGLPNFPAGVPFTFWEQYIGLRFWLGVAVASVLAAVFAAVATVFVNAWLAAVVCVVVASIVVQLFGVMAVLAVHLSAIPAVIIILAVGLGVEFTLHICIVSSTHQLKKYSFVLTQHSMIASLIFSGLCDQSWKPPTPSEEVFETHVCPRLPRSIFNFLERRHA